MSCLIVFYSVTHAQNAAAILTRNGIAAVLVKPPTSLGRGSCSYALKVDERYLPAAMQLIQKTSIPVLGTYDMMNNGTFREVVW